MKKYVLSLALALVFFSVEGQEIKNNEDGAWLTIINKFKVTNKLYVSNVIEWRLVDLMSYTRIFLVEPSVNYKFNNKITAGIGYNYSNYSLAGIRPPTLDDENRIWQHITVSSNFGKLKMNQRFRFEERFLTKNNGDNGYSNRFRYRITLSFNLWKFENEKHLLAKVSDELRIRFTEGVSNPNFGQNNFLAAVGYPLLSNSKIYVGYGRNYYNAGSGIYWGDHILNAMISYDFDFTKK